MRADAVGANTSQPDQRPDVLDKEKKVGDDNPCSAMRGQEMTQAESSL
jgi:hypothetical protein